MWKTDSRTAEGAGGGGDGGDGGGAATGSLQVNWYLSASIHSPITLAVHLKGDIIPY